MDKDTLRRMQLVQLEILIEFDRICRDNNLVYQLFSGTLLGAVRHKGFIPWDDDVDVCMLREDYDRFIEICKGALSDKYFLQTHETDKEYIHTFARLRKNNTLALQNSYSNIKMHHGIFIDIFPMDKVELGSLKGKLQKKLIYTIRRVKRLKIKNRFNHKKKDIRQLFKYLTYYCLKPINMRVLNRIESNLVCIFKDSDNPISTLLTDGPKITYDNYIIINKEFDDLIELDFEECKFYGPRNYEQILTNNFGNYMIPPPIGEQKPHHNIIEINFNVGIK